MPKTKPDPETLAIVKATYSALETRQAALTLRMWHHLLPYAERDALFGDYPGQNGSLIQSFLAAADQRMHGAWPRLRQATGLRRDHLPMLIQAFGRAVEDVLGKLGAPMVIRAWCEMLRAYLGELCRRPAA